LTDYKTNIKKILILIMSNLTK